jgi:hypothetical protein
MSILSLLERFYDMQADIRAPLLPILPDKQKRSALADAACRKNPGKPALVVVTEKQQQDQYHHQKEAKTADAVAVMRAIPVIAPAIAIATAAENKDQQNDDKDQKHGQLL